MHKQQTIVLLLSSIYIRKYWMNENFRRPVFDRFACFEMSWTRFDDFLENLLVCMSPKFCEYSPELMRRN